jgi:hypothetical protein
MDLPCFEKVRREFQGAQKTIEGLLAFPEQAGICASQSAGVFIVKAGSGRKWNLWSSGSRGSCGKM